jgi:hypothetical protein
MSTSFATAKFKRGDLVIAQGHSGVFQILGLSDDSQRANVQLFSLSTHQILGSMMNVPASTLLEFRPDVPKP